MTKQPFPIRLVYKAPVFLLLMVGFVYAIVIFVNFGKDTTAITNSAFVIMAALAALSFSFASGIDSDQLRDQIVFAGERLLHGAVLVLVASLLKYLILIVLKSNLLSSLPLLETISVMTIGILVGIIFSNGILFAHTGLRLLNDLLLSRMTRQPDWDDVL